MVLEEPVITDSSEQHVTSEAVVQVRTLERAKVAATETVVSVQREVAVVVHQPFHSFGRDS